MNLYGKELKKAFKKQGCKEDEIASKVGMKKERLLAIVNGEKQATFLELVAICSCLSLDVNQLLGIEIVDNEYMMIEDELQIKLNTITRSIHKDDQGNFVKAVEYLAECFVIKDKQKK